MGKRKRLSKFKRKRRKDERNECYGRVASQSCINDTVHNVDDGAGEEVPVNKDDYSDAKTATISNCGKYCHAVNVTGQTIIYILQADKSSTSGSSLTPPKKKILALDIKSYIIRERVLKTSESESDEPEKGDMTHWRKQSDVSGLNTYFSYNRKRKKVRL